MHGSQLSVLALWTFAWKVQNRWKSEFLVLDFPKQSEKNSSTLY